MFKKGFTGSSKTKVKSSVQRQLKAKLSEQFPLLAPHVDEVIPKKSDLELIKAPDKLSIYTINNEIIFFQHYDDTIYPHLKLVHKFPQCFPTLQIDRGAIRYILGGAQLMCPGLTSAGGKLPPAEAAIPKDKVVAIAAEGKEHACMVGKLAMGTEDIKRVCADPKIVNKGVGAETIHYLGDGLWNFHID